MIESDVAVIGGGIVGLAIAHELLSRLPGTSVALIEKERDVAMHQSGRNSGVIHSGIYYAPGSAKARLARAGCESIKELCRETGVPYRTAGKLIVAVEDRELAGLAELERRGLENGIECTMLDRDGARQIEPNVSCEKALLVPSAGVVDYRGVCAIIRNRIEERGCRTLFGSPVRRIERVGGRIELDVGAERVRTSRLINAGGLHSDRLAKLDGVKSSTRIIPFRGEYYTVTGASADLVRSLIYPVPDVRYPFLGVHLTRSIDDVVHAGPNAVLALAREGYRWSKVSVRDLLDTLSFPGFWKFLARHSWTAMAELKRSIVPSTFARSVRRLVPAVEPGHLVRSQSGVRAQALESGGGLVDDFVIEGRGGAIHILNAPSPAATACLEIARVVADYLPQSESA